MLKSYLENRRQRIKIGNNYSEWDTLIKGVPQGSILKNTKKIAPSGGSAKMFGVFRVKNYDFTPKNLIFFQF